MVLSQRRRYYLLDVLSQLTNNKIDMKQEIVEAAYDYATQKTKFRKEVLKEVDADTYVSRHADSMEDFQCGAQWQSKQSQWISVKERLPEPDKEVLLYDKNAIRHYVIGWLRRHKDITKACGHRSMDGLKIRI